MKAPKLEQQRKWKLIAENFHFLSVENFLFPSFSKNIFFKLKAAFILAENLFQAVVKDTRKIIPTSKH